MKCILDKETRTEIINRISLINANCTAQWGKMSVGQMVKHVTLCEELYLGKVKFKRVFIGRVFGRLALKRVLNDDRPLQKNSPTAPMLVVSEEIADLEAQKQKWIALINE